MLLILPQFHLPIRSFNMSHSGIFGSTFTGPANAHFEPEPNRRGTFAIFSTCFLTLGLCVWTSLHFNVPGHKESGFSQFLRKTGWMLMGLVCPELVRHPAPFLALLYADNFNGKRLLSLRFSNTHRQRSSLKSWHPKNIANSYGHGKA